MNSTILSLVADKLEHLISLVYQPSNPYGGLTIVVGVVTTILYLFYQRHFTPLGKIPGPFFASFSRWWLVIYARRKRRHTEDIELHRKYGPVVRIGPNEVSISSPAALDIIYGSNAVTAYRKGLWYDGIGGAAPDGLNLLGERIEMEKYKRQRQLLGPIYSATSMKDFGPLVDEVINKNIKKMRELEGEFVDLDSWVIMFVIDLMSNIVFSKSVGFIEKKGCRDDGTVATLHKSWDYMHWVGYIPGLLDVNEWISARMPQINWNNRLIHVTDIFEFGTREVEARRCRKVPNDKLDLGGKLVKLHHENPNFQAVWLRNMTMTNFGAGIVTIPVAISALFYYVTKYGYQDRILKEIISARKTGRLSDLPKINEFHDELPFLEACLHESMRLHPCVGITLPRIVPKSGIEIEGVYLPEGTTVGINPWVQNHDKTIFGDDADEYRPERWIGLTDEKRRQFGKSLQLRRMFANILNEFADKYSMRFGHGARDCPGKDLAYLIMAKMIPAVLLNFKLYFEKAKDRDEAVDIKTTFFPHFRDVTIGWKNI